MFYTWEISLSAGGTESGKVKRVLEMERGTVNRMNVVFPSGCAGLVYCYIADALYQVLPKNANYQLRGDDVTIVTTDEYAIAEEPFTLQFWGWNTDDTFDHTVIVRIQLVPARELMHKVVGGLSRFTGISRTR